jgi:lipopolysaccharide transport system permease protein
LVERFLISLLKNNNKDYMNIKIYTSSHNESFLKMLNSVVQGFVEGRELAFRLFLRDFKTTYQASVLGFIWVFVPPIITACIWIFLNNQQIISVKQTAMHYPTYVICGVLLWSLFTESLNKPIQRYNNSKSMMVKLNFPKEAILLAAFYDLMLSLILKLLIIIMVLWVSGYYPNFNTLLAIPCMVGIIFIGFSFGVFIAPFCLIFDDVTRFIGLTLQFMMYMTTAIYPIAEKGTLRIIQIINPITPWIERTRSLLGGYQFSLYFELLFWLIIPLLLFVLGLVFLRISLPIIIERSGS